MSQSVKTDPVTLRPVKEIQDNRLAERVAAEKRKLQEQYEFGSVLASEAAERLMDVIEAGLIEAFESFLKTDQAGGAYMNMLKKLGSKRKVAKQAAQEIIKKNWGGRKETDSRAV